jgi:glycosyltransferase involved in cell wall biosynthesis
LSITLRLFQNSGIPAGYKRRLDAIAREHTTFNARLSVFLGDRYGASHFLKPVLDGDSNAFFTNGDDIELQRAWAREHGLPRSAELEDILLAQIEEHRPDVFYNLDPLRYDSNFVRKLPSCVKKKLCWRAAPSPGNNFVAYDLVVCNFPSIIESWRRQGLRAGYFAPAHDPAMDDCVEASGRSIDMVFVGSYTRHHVRRARTLEAASRLAAKYRVVLCLDPSRLTRLAETPLGMVPLLYKHRRPDSIRQVASGPVFGLDLYRMLASSKIVLNGAIDMSGEDRGNMRCFEAMGCGALLVSDRGRYPQGMIAGQNMLDYASEADVADVVGSALDNWPRYQDMAERGRQMVRSEYSKERQWESFQKLLELA